MSWKKTNKCSRCGKQLARKTEAGAVTPSTPVTFENTGDRLCVDCALEIAGTAMPEDSGPAIQKFLDDTIRLVSLRADVDPLLITARCRTFVSSDVEIRKTARGYDLTLYSLLMADPEQTQKVVDYVVQWIRTHPLEVKALSTKRMGPQELGDDGLFVFLFIPASRPFPESEDIAYMAGQIAPGFPSDKIGWRIMSQPEDTGPQNHAFIADAVQSWSLEQSDTKSIKVAPRPTETRAGRKLMCLVAYRDG